VIVMPDPLEGCRAKIGRAKEHLDVLKVSIDDLIPDFRTV